VAIATPEQDHHTVDIKHIEAVQARSIGVETLAFHAAIQLQLDQKLAALGFNKIDAAAALGSIIGRMVSPGSELQTYDWLQTRTGLGELLDHDYGSTSLTRLYTISDKLLQHQATLESGTDSRTIQLLLGHRSLATTSRYLKVATTTVCATTSPFDCLPRIESLAILPAPPAHF
jgi:hypothetical protein